MKTITYEEFENGSRYVSAKGKKMDVLEEISKAEFEKRFPDVSVYGISMYSAVYLENGIVCISNEWNGEYYIVKKDNKEVRIVPVYKEIDNEDFEIIGYYEA